ncbi:MAG: hypothetical protein LBK68_03595 [Candidatus Margulisbacteria bacterium]|jgi:hypothetical protein|nr:hypothetical protein [Candidatus Margulisiibacteriota bacterium]
MWHSKFVSDNGSARRLSDKMILAHGRELLHVRNSPFVDRQHYHILVDGAQAGDILLYRGNEALLLTYINIDREYRGTGLAKNIFKSCQVAARFLALKQLTIFHVNNYNLIQIGSKIKNLKYHWPKENMFLTAAQILSLAEKMKIEFYNEE